MNGIPKWGCVIPRALVGAVAGSISGAAIGGLTGQGVGILMARTDDEMAICGSWMMFIFCAVFAAPGSGIGAACGAVGRRALLGAIAGSATGFLVSLYLGTLFWLNDDDNTCLQGYLPTTAALISSGMLVSAAVGRLARWLKEQETAAPGGDPAKGPWAR